MRAQVLNPVRNITPPEVEVAQENIGRVNTRNAGNGVTTLGFWIGLLIAYLIWDMVVTKNKKIGDVVDPGNIRTNLYNLVFIGFAAVIFINGMKIILVKIAAWNIPGISWVCEQLLPLFQ